MAGKTVKTLNYKIDLDSKGFNNGVKATKKELTEARKVMREITTPSEKLAQQLTKLDNLRKKGLISQDAYNRKLKQLKTGFDTTTKSAKRFAGTMKGIGTSLKSAAVGFASFAAVRGVFTTITSQIEKMDKVAKAARNVGTSTEFLSGLDFVAQRTSGFSEGQTTDAIKKMTTEINKAALGFGRAKDGLKGLNLNAGELARMNPEKQFEAITKAVQELNDTGQARANLAKIFGDTSADIVSTMQLQTGEYKEQVALADKLGILLKKN
jgi:hypothetical protein